MHCLLSAFAGRAVHTVSVPKYKVSDFEGSSTEESETENCSFEL